MSRISPPLFFDLTLFPLLGHYNLFIGGVLHRDVSCGNILRLQEPIIQRRLDPPRTCKFEVVFLRYVLLLLEYVLRLEKILGQGVDLGQCRGILIDGDHAIEWRKGAIALSSERSVCCNPLHILWMIS